MRVKIRNLASAEMIGSVLLQMEPLKAFALCVWSAVFFLGTAVSTGAQTSDSLVPCWRYSDPASASGGLIVDDSKVYLVTSDNRVLALDRNNGAVVWTSELGGNIALPIRSLNSSIIVVSSTASPDAKPRTSFLRAISKNTGITNWVSTLPPASRYILSGDDRALYILAAGASLSAVDPVNGSIKWIRDGNAFPDVDPHFGGNWFARMRGAKAIEVISLEDWKVLGRFKLRHQPRVIASRGNESLVVGDSRGNLDLISLGSGSKGWSYKAGGAISHLQIREDSVVVASADNFVYSISLSSGNVEWKRRMPGRVNSMGTLADTKLVLTVVGEKTAYILDLSDGRFAGRVGLEGDQEFVGHPLAGDDRFVVALTNRGVAAFSASCPAQKAAGEPAA